MGRTRTRPRLDMDLFLVSVSENMVAGADPTPLTTTVSLIYDAKKPESPPEIGLGFNIEL